MRQKVIPRRKLTRPRANRTTAAANPTTEPVGRWLVRNELGWGLPHPLVAVLAGLVWVYALVRLRSGHASAAAPSRTVSSRSAPGRRSR